MKYSKTLTGTVLSFSLIFSGIGAANATDDTNRNGKISVNNIEKELTSSEKIKLEKNVQLLFEIYLSRDNNGNWYVTETGLHSEVPNTSLRTMAQILNNGPIKPNGNNSERSYSQCILDKSGFGFVGGAARGALNRLIQKKMWKQAAIKIISIVGRSALKGGVVGLVAALIAAAGWCALPWVN